jgi:hypothetical protein
MAGAPQPDEAQIELHRNGRMSALDFASSHPHENDKARIVADPKAPPSSASNMRPSLL